MSTAEHVEISGRHCSWVEMGNLTRLAQLADRNGTSADRSNRGLKPLLGIILYRHCRDATVANRVAHDERQNLYGWITETDCAQANLACLAVLSESRS